MALFSDDPRTYWRITSRNNDFGTGTVVTVFIEDGTNGPLSETVNSDVVAAIRGVLDAAGGQTTTAQRTDSVNTTL